MRCALLSLHCVVASGDEVSVDVCWDTTFDVTHVQKDVVICVSPSTGISSCDRCVAAEGLYEWPHNVHCHSQRHKIFMASCVQLINGAHLRPHERDA